MPIKTPTSIPFGPFEVDLRTQELRKGGIRLHLPRQSFQILRMLLTRPGELVTREELRRELWPSDTFVDFEHGLNAAVNKLRQVLGMTRTIRDTLRRCRAKPSGEISPRSGSEVPELMKDTSPPDTETCARRAVCQNFSTK